VIPDTVPITTFIEVVVALAAASALI
jgi:hypothetical protein